MLKVTTVLVLALMVTVSLAMAQEKVPVMGNWQGEFTSADWKDRTLRAQIVADSWVLYRAILYVGAKGVEEQRVQVRGKTDEKSKEGRTDFSGRVDLGEKLGGIYMVTGEAANGVFKGVFKKQDQEIGFEMKRVLLKSPTLGMKPPEGAVVLMDGTEKTFHDEWIIQPRWILDKEGSAQISGSSILTKKEFGDAQYHVEFCTPFMPESRDQARGNSGVYVHGRYEVQVLDSFADEPQDNLCGGIYKIAKPLENACLPPLEWQTYDITFHPPRFDASGKKIKDAEITVKQNGTVIHDKLVMKTTTPGGVSEKETPKGQFLLQDHGDRVRYRNVWIKPLD
ncbi:MAG: DUF1080 domain-containing protein [bacterium]